LLPVTPDFLNLVQRVLVVDCSEQNQIERVINRNGMKLSEIRTIIAQQPPRADMLKMADDVIYNNEDMFNLRNQVKILHDQYAHSKNGN
jgi:dephospho-CoA kinase